MYDVSPEYRYRIKLRSHVCEWYGTLRAVDTAGHPVTYNIKYSDIKQGSGRITKECSDGDKIQIGTAFAGQAELGLYLDYDNGTYYLDGKEVSSYCIYNGTLTLYFRLYYDENPRPGSERYEEVPCGIYTVSEVKRKANVLFITAYDSMLKFDKEVDPSDFPLNQSAYYWLAKACQVCGVTKGFDTSSIADYINGTTPLTLPENAKISTWRDVIGYVCACIGTFAYINRFDMLCVKKYDTSTLSDTDYQIRSLNRYDSEAADYASIFDFLMAYNEVTKTDEFYGRGAGKIDPSEVTANSLIYDFGDNPFVQDETTRDTILSAVMDYIGSIFFYKVNASMPSNPAFDIGDMVKFIDNQFGQATRDGNASSVGSAITQYTINIGGAADMTCGGENPYTQKIKGRIGSAVEDMEKKTDEGGGGDITVDPLNVTSNGTYTAEEDHAYNPVSVNVPTPLGQTLECVADGALDLCDLVCAKKVPAGDHPYTEIQLLFPDGLYLSGLGSLGYKDGEIYACHYDTNKVYAIDVNEYIENPKQTYWQDVTYSCVPDVSSILYFQDGLIVYRNSSNVQRVKCYDIYNNVSATIKSNTSSLNVGVASRYGVSGDAVIVGIDDNNGGYYSIKEKFVVKRKGQNITVYQIQGDIDPDYIPYRDQYMLDFNFVQGVVFIYNNDGQLIKSINIPSGWEGFYIISGDRLYCRRVQNDITTIGYGVFNESMSEISITTVLTLESDCELLYWDIDYSLSKIIIVTGRKDSSLPRVPYSIYVDDVEQFPPKIDVGSWVMEPFVLYEDNLFLNVLGGPGYQVYIPYYYLSAYKMTDVTDGDYFGYTKNAAADEASVNVEALLELDDLNVRHNGTYRAQAGHAYDVVTVNVEGGGGQGVEVVPLNVTENDTYTAPEGQAYSPVTVNVPQNIDTETLSVTENGEYDAPQGKAYNHVSVSVSGGGGDIDVIPLNVIENDTYTAPEGYAYSPVTVNVPQVDLDSISITENGVYTPPAGTAYNSITVNVSSGIEIDSLSVTENGVYNPQAGHAYGTVTVDVPQIYTGTVRIYENGTYYPITGEAFDCVIVEVPQTTLIQLDVINNGSYSAPSGSAYETVNVDVPRPNTKSTITGIAAENLSKGDTVYMYTKPYKEDIPLHTFSGSIVPQQNNKIGACDGMMYFMVGSYMYQFDMRVSSSSPVRVLSNYTIHSYEDGIAVISDSSNYYVVDISSNEIDTSDMISIPKSSVLSGGTVTAYIKGGDFVDIVYRNASNAQYIHDIHERGLNWKRNGWSFESSDATLPGGYMMARRGLRGLIVLSDTQYIKISLDRDGSIISTNTHELNHTIKSSTAKIYNGVIYCFDSTGANFGYIDVNNFTDFNTLITGSSSFYECSVSIHDYTGAYMYSDIGAMSLYDNGTNTLYFYEGEPISHSYMTIDGFEPIGRDVNRIIYRRSDQTYHVWRSLDNTKVYKTSGQEYIAKTTNIRSDTNHLGYVYNNYNTGDTVNMYVLFSW